jgi:hypothetical protein
MTARSLLALAVAFGVVGTAACSIVNAPEDVKAVETSAGTGGAGGGSTTSAPECAKAIDCDPNFVCSGKVCTEGKCVNGTPPELDDKNKCTLDACDPKAGVTHTKIDPADDDACTKDSCDPVKGIVHTPIDPNDDNLCTVDTCDSKTGVKNTPLGAIDDGNFCHENSCDPKTGDITHTPKDGCHCAHSVCAEGDALDPKTCTFGPSSDCAAKVCLKDAKCCSTGWTKECVDLAKDPTVCSANPGGFSCTCTHEFTCVGVALFAKCDPCVKIVCDALPKCCNDGGPTGWSADCVAATQQLCNAKPNPNCP